MINSERIFLSEKSPSILHLSIDRESCLQIAKLQEKGYYVNHLDEESEIKTIQDFYKFALPRLRVGYYGTSLDALYDRMTTLKIPKRKRGVILVWSKPGLLLKNDPEWYHAFVELISEVDERWFAKKKQRIFLVLGTNKRKWWKLFLGNKNI